MSFKSGPDDSHMEGYLNAVADQRDALCRGVRAVIEWAQRSDGVPLDSYEVQRRLEAVLAEGEP